MGSAANEYPSDPRTPRDPVGASTGAGAASRPAANDDPREELAKLRAQVERLMQERVTPALAGAADQVQDYARSARETIEHQADALSETVRERPLLAIGVAALGGYLIGRLMGGTTYVYNRDHR
jgi:ElaB/YqjD/DUF883 family membrane-anchored ribosome-binding protein